MDLWKPFQFGFEHAIKRLIIAKLWSIEHGKTCFNKFHIVKQDTEVLWFKSSTLDWKVQGSNPAAANFSFEVDDLDARRKKEDGNENRRARKRPLTRERA